MTTPNLTPACANAASLAHNLNAASLTDGLTKRNAAKIIALRNRAIALSDAINKFAIKIDAAA